MTHCQSCGAPYKPNSQVCEYCGTVREKSPDEIKLAQELEQAHFDVEQARQEFLTLRLQAAQRAQHDNIKFNLGNGSVIINSIIGSGNSIKSIQTMCKTVTPDPSQQAACGAQALANATSHNIATCSFEQMRLNAEQARVSEEQFCSHLLCFVILTFLLPLYIPICLILSIKTAIVAKLLGMVLIPTWFCLGYIISLRGMKRYKGGRR